MDTKTDTKSGLRICRCDLAFGVHSFARNGFSHTIPQRVSGGSWRIVQCKMSMKPELIPMQHEHETGCGGMLRPDAINDAECRTFEPRANPGVSGIERRNRVRRARARRDICVDRTRCGSARIRRPRGVGASTSRRGRLDSTTGASALFMKARTACRPIPKTGYRLQPLSSWAFGSMTTSNWS
jgi:hypothetical protein